MTSLPGFAMQISSISRKYAIRSLPGALRIHRAKNAPVQLVVADEFCIVIAVFVPNCFKLEDFIDDFARIGEWVIRLDLIHAQLEGSLRGKWLFREGVGPIEHVFAQQVQGLHEIHLHRAIHAMYDEIAQPGAPYGPYVVYMRRGVDRIGAPHRFGELVRRRLIKGKVAMIR